MTNEYNPKRNTSFANLTETLEKYGFLEDAEIKGYVKKIEDTLGSEDPQSLFNREAALADLCIAVASILAPAAVLNEIDLNPETLSPNS